MGERTHLWDTSVLIDPPVDARGTVTISVVSVMALDAAVRAAGRQPRRRLADLQIAATALAHGLPLVTRNPADLAGLERLLEWSSPG